LPVLSDQTQIPPDQLVSSLKSDIGVMRGETGLAQKGTNSRSFVTLGCWCWLMGLDIGFGYSPNRFQEFRCRYGYAFHVIFLISKYGTEFIYGQFSVSRF
jgi:hypothetical protein